MFKHNILNLVLFIILVSLASTIYFSEEASLQLPQLTNADIKDIDFINIHHNENDTRIVKQADDQWQITQPVAIAANNFRINSLLKLLNAPVHNQYPADEIDINKFGLSAPDTTIELNDYTIAFGIVSPITNLRYLRMNDTVYTIEDVYYPLISSHFSSLVSLNLLPVNSSIEKLILLNQTIDKDDKGRWRSNIGSSADAMVNTIQHWQRQQAFAVHEYLQRDALGEIFIYLKDQQQPVRYVITDDDPWLIIARPEIGLEYHLELDTYNLLVNPVDSNNPPLSTD